MLDRYLSNLSVEVEPFALVIPTGTVHSLDTRVKYDHELKIECTPTGPPVHHIVAGKSPAEFRG